MAVTKAKKAEILSNLKQVLESSVSVWFTSNNWLSVEEITNLRTKLRESDSSIMLAKKTLIKIAFKEVYNVEIDDSILPGQIAIVCSKSDAIAWMSCVNSFMKEVKNKMEFTWSYFEWIVQNADQTKEIASMPSRETLLWRLVWSMQSPLSSLARFFDAASKDLEEKAKSKVWELKVETKKEEKVEEKAEEVKVEAKEEIKAEENKTEEANKEA